MRFCRVLTGPWGRYVTASAMLGSGPTSSPGDDGSVLAKVAAEDRGDARTQAGVVAPGSAAPELCERVPVEQQLNSSSLRIAPCHNPSPWRPVVAGTRTHTLGDTLHQVASGDWEYHTSRAS